MHHNVIVETRTMPAAFNATPSAALFTKRSPCTHHRRPSHQARRFTMSLSPRVVVGEVSAKSASFVHELSKAHPAGAPFSVAVSGGSLPRLLGDGLQPLQTDKSAWRVFLADERIVPLDHADSNYASVTAHLKCPVVPIDPTLAPDACAAHYERLIVDALGDTPQFDLVLLGLGPDGHTCSLFPGHPLLDVTDKLVASISDSPKPPPQRVTLTYPVLAAAKNIAFVVTGESKAEVLKDILENPNSALPGAKVRPQSGNLTWFLDEAAASKLKSYSAAK